MNDRTGRTTRMLEAAIEKARGGEDVYVVGRNPEQAKYLQLQVAGMTGTEPFATRVRVGDGEITFETVTHESWNWHTLRHTGMFPTVPVFLDHYALEGQFGHIIEAFHRWDEAVEAGVVAELLEACEAVVKAESNIQWPISSWIAELEAAIAKARAP